MEYCLLYLKLKSQKSRGRYKRVKQIFQSNKNSNDELKNLLGSFPDKNNEFQLQTVSYEDVEQCLRLPRNDCSTGYDNIPAMSIKQVVEF